MHFREKLRNIARDIAWRIRTQLTASDLMVNTLFKQRKYGKVRLYCRGFGWVILYLLAFKNMRRLMAKVSDQT